ncbi:MAG: BON domain-containing protein [Chloroflexia bacterium]
MAKITLRVPEITFRKETMEVPPEKVGVVKKALLAQQMRVNDRLSKRNAEVAVKLDEAARKQGGGRAKWVLLGVGTAIGAGVGVLIAPTRGAALRAQVGKYARTTADSSADTARSVTSTVRGKASAAQSRFGQPVHDDVEPETITTRVQTELGENKVIGALPRINVNADFGGVVYLRGTVPGEKEREIAEKIATKQRGVTKVVNELQLADTMDDSQTPSSESVQ